MAMIEVENLKKSYNGFEALEGVSLSVGEGETFGFIGPNGAGKTTTINILCSLLSPTSGRATVNGHDCVNDPYGVRSSIGLVFQEVTLDNELTAHENLKFHCYLYGMERRLTEKRIDEILEVVGLSGLRNDFVNNFSGGMKRRLEIARGLLHRPKVLFLDEPTLGLDPQTRRSVWNFIAELKKREGNTIFMTTHYLDEAEVCDRIAIIDNGAIIACESPAGLKSALKGDTIYLNTEDDAAAEIELRERFSVEPKLLSSGGIAFMVEGAESFIPRLLSGLKTGVKSVNLKKPSLDDVFLHLTGRDVRDAGGMEAGAREARKRH